MKRNLSILFLFLFLIGMISGCAASVPRPEIKDGRFHFSVTYEVNGEIQTISGVYACKFVRAEANLTGQNRVWECKVENRDIPDVNRYEILTNEDGVIYLDLGLDPTYFMSDPFYDGDGCPKASVFIVYRDEISKEKGGFSIDPVLLESYGVKVISCEYDTPIPNNYQ